MIEANGRIGHSTELHHEEFTESLNTMRIPVHREHSFRFNVNTDSADAERRFRSS